jgi:hypothetical protein
MTKERSLWMAMRRDLRKTVSRDLKLIAARSDLDRKLCEEP